MAIKLEKKDVAELEKSVPVLNCEIKNQRIWGTLQFCCWYDSKTKEIEHGSNHDKAISDSYEIEIKLRESDTFQFPVVYETGHKVPKEKCFHINEDGSCCLGIFPEYKWASAHKFIIDKVVPFFYWQSHKRIHGKEPWKGYSHEEKGLEEALRDYENKLKLLEKDQIAEKNFERNQVCSCGSEKKYKKCCLSKHQEQSRKISEMRLSIGCIRYEIDCIEIAKRCEKPCS